MIFAEIEYTKRYEQMHQELVLFISKKFKQVESGLQGDSWIWVFEDNDKVAIDTFSSMTHEIKSADKESKLVKKVISHLASNYQLHVYQSPEAEAHEGDF